MTAGDEPPSPSARGVWFLLGAVAVVVITVGVAGVITWVAFEGRDDTEGRLDTEAAAARLTELVDGGGLASCPAGVDERVLGDLGAALGGGTFTELADEGKVTVAVEHAGPEVVVRCVASGDAGVLAVMLSPTPAAVVLRQGATEGWEGLGASRGGTYAGRCGGDECIIVWSDGKLLAGLVGSGPAFVGIERDRVQAALAAALPSLVAGMVAA